MTYQDPAGKPARDHSLRANLLGTLSRIMRSDRKLASLLCSHYFSIFNNIASRLLGRQDTQTLIQVIVDKSVEITRADFGYIHLLNPSTQTLEIAAVSNTSTDIVNNITTQKGIGAAGVAWATAETIVIDDYQAWSQKVVDDRLLQMKSAMAVPMILGDDVVGVIGLGAKRKNRFDSGDSNMLSQLSQLATIALDNAQLHEQASSELQRSQSLTVEIQKSGDLYRSLYETTEKRLRRAQSLVAISQCINTLAELNDIVNEVSQITRLALGCECLAIFKFDTSNSSPILLTHAHFGSQLSSAHSQEHIRQIENQMVEMIESQQAVVSFIDEAGATHGRDNHIGRMITNDIVVNDKRWGVLVACEPIDSAEFETEDLQMLQGTANQLSLAVIQKRLAERIAHQATHDELTGLPNRRKFRERADLAIKNYENNGVTFAVLLIDLNGFKGINDTYGHSVGDGLLYRIGQRVETKLTANDTIARLGGDEFVILLTDVNTLDHVVKFTKDLVDCIDEPFAIDGLVVSVGISIGISLFPRHGNDLSTVLKAADTAMYSVKGASQSDFQIFSDEMDTTIESISA